MSPFFFGIPLRAKSTTNDWDLVCENLARTLDCLLDQDDAEAGVIIAGHDRPEFLTDPRVRFIDVSETAAPPVDVEGFNRDKRVKKNRIGYELGRIVQDPVYFMHIDADDLLHRRFVQGVLKDDNKKGYLIGRGYMVDVAFQRIAPADENTTSFYKHCGSCAVLHFSPKDFPKTPSGHGSKFSQYKHHAQYHEVAESQGKPLKILSGHMGAYLVNHGENNRRYRGLDYKKTTFVERNEITDREHLDLICANFKGLDKIMSRRDT